MVDLTAIQAQLRSGQITADQAKQQLSSGLAVSYGGTSTGQFTDHYQQSQYQQALQNQLPNLFSGVGTAQQGGNVGTFDLSGNFVKQSTNVNQSITNGGGTTATTTTVGGGASAPSAINKYGSPTTGYYSTYQQAEAAANNILKLPQAQAPGSASSINNVSTINLPTANPSAPGTEGVGGMMAYYNELFKTAEKQQQDYQAQIKEREAANKDLTAQLLGGLESPSAARSRAMTETGINPQQYFAEERAQIAEIGKLNEEYNSVLAARDSQIAATNDKLGSNNFINNQIAQIERNAAPKLNLIAANIKSKAAVLEATQGRFQEAQNYINQAVQDATAENRFKYELFNIFYEQNQNVIDRLDANYKDALAQGREAAEKAWSLSVDEKTRVGDLMLQYPRSGISLADSFGSAQTKAAKWLALQESQLTIAPSGGTSTRSSGSTGTSTGIGSNGLPGPEETKKANDILNQISTIENSKNIFGGSAINPGVGFGIRKALPSWLGGNLLRPDLVAFDSEIDRLKALLSVDNLKLFRGTGPLSDRDLQVIQSVGTSLNSGMSESAFRKELERLKTLFGKVSSTATIDQLAQQKGFDVEAARAAGYTDEEINQFLNQ